MIKWVFIGVVAIGIFVLPLMMADRFFNLRAKKIVETLQSPVHIVAVKETTNYGGRKNFDTA
jgi:hypothetical protein